MILIPGPEVGISREALWAESSFLTCTAQTTQDEPPLSINITNKVFPILGSFTHQGWGRARGSHQDCLRSQSFRLDLNFLHLG